MYPCLVHQCLEAHEGTLVILYLLEACTHLLPSEHNGALIHIFSRHIPKSLECLHCEHLLLEIDVHESKELQRGLKEGDLWDRDTGSNDEIIIYTSLPSFTLAQKSFMPLKSIRPNRIVSHDIFRGENA